MSFLVLSKKEFDDFVQTSMIESGYNVTPSNESNEIVYLLDIPDSNMVIKIYSSVDRHHEVSRDKGKDAIRILLWDNISQKSVSETKKVNRTNRDTIFSRILTAIQELLDNSAELPICKSCGSVMMKRWPGGNKKRPYFFGCLRFPDCNATISQDGKFKGNSVVQKEAIEEIKNHDLTEELEEIESAPIQRRIDEISLTEGRTQVEILEVDAETQELVSSSETDTDEENLVYDFENFNPVQSAFFPFRVDRKNFVIATMTGSGKTIIAEMKMNQSVMRGKKACYLSPLKAVTQERYDDWTGNHSFSDLNISIVTGDYQLTDKRKKELREADIILMTTEMLGARVRNFESEKNEFLMQIDTLVIDEVHLIGLGDVNETNNRGPKLEVGLIDFCRLNKNCDLVMLSATIPNCDDLATWCTVLNGKDSMIIRSDWRPCKLNMKFVPFEGNSSMRAYKDNQYRMAEAISYNVCNRDNNALCFVHSKATSGPILLSTLKKSGVQADYHNADLELKKRIEIEGNFRKKEKGKKKCLVATATLAWGMNLPARDVHIMGIKRGIKTVHPYDIIQMAGRAGRPGYDDEGDCFIYLPTSTYTRDMEYILNLPPLESLLNNKEELVFHLVAEIYNKVVRTPSEAKLWFNSSFAAVLGGQISGTEAAEIFQELLFMKMIRKNMKTPEYVVTPLGMISTWLYLKPYDVFDWYRNFTHLNNEGIFDEDDDVSISWALGNIHSYIYGGYLTEEELDRMKSYDYMLVSRGLDCKGNAIKACYFIYNLLKGETNMGVVQREIKNDADRWIQAISMIDSMYSKWGFNRSLDTLKYRIRYGCTSEQAALCKIQGVGAVIMKRLWAANIKSADDIVEMPSRVLKALKTKGGKTTIAKKIIDNARKLLKMDEEHDDDIPF